MELLLSMGLQALEIFVLVLGIAGLVISLLLLFSPKLIKTCSKTLDRKITVDKTLSYLNRAIQTDSITYRYNVRHRACFNCRIGFFFYFFYFFKWRSARSVALFSDPRYSFFSRDRRRSFLVLIGKIAGIAGLIFGFLILLADA